MTTHASVSVARMRDLLLARAVELGMETEVDSDRTIEALLDREIRVPDAGEDECRRYYEAHAGRFAADEWVDAAHILFAVTPGMNVAALVRQAERTLAAVRTEPSTFAACAREFSNCPSGRDGGDLGRLRRGDVVAEMESVLFTPGPLGVLPEVVRTRYGLHVVRIDHRDPGRAVPFEAVCDRIRTELAGVSWETAARQYVQWLQQRADAARGEPASPLVQ
jgi:peptidyl-prolyl cis-trans isomerase C